MITCSFPLSHSHVIQLFLFLSMALDFLTFSYTPRSFSSITTLSFLYTYFPFVSVMTHLLTFLSPICYILSLGFSQSLPWPLSLSLPLRSLPWFQLGRLITRVIINQEQSGRSHQCFPSRPPQLLPFRGAHRIP